MTTQPMRVALVTGATGGIGTAVSRALARRPDRALVLTGRNRNRLRDLTSTCRDLQGSMCYGLEADLSQESAVIDLFARVCEFGALTEWIHCLGIELPGPVRNLTGEAVEATVATHLLSTVFGAREFLRRWDGERPITWVWIGSRRAGVPSPEDAIYAASKAALASLARTLREEVANPRLRVSLIEPARVDGTGSAATQAEAALSPGDVAAAVNWVLSLPSTVEIPRLELRHPADLRPVPPGVQPRWQTGSPLPGK